MMKDKLTDTGVYVERADGALRFRRLEAPTSAERMDEAEGGDDRIK